MQRQPDEPNVTAVAGCGLLARWLTAPDGARLLVYEAGDRRHRTVLLSLPVGVRVDPLRPLVDALARSYRVLVAQSRWVDDDTVNELAPEQAIDLAAHARDVAFIVDELEVGSAHLVGYCSGALIALASASPLDGIVQSVSLCNGAYVLRPDGSDYEQAMLDLATRYAQRPRMARVVYPALRQQTFAVADKSIDGKDWGRHLTQMRDFETFLKYIQVVRGLYVDSVLEQLKPVTVPVLALSGALDAMMPPSQFEAVRHLLPNSVHHVLEEEDHYLPCRVESRGLALLHNFLAESDR